MRGDVILVGEEHRLAAGRIVDRLIDAVRSSGRRFIITVAGESGSGKSETGQALAEAFEERGVRATVQVQRQGAPANFCWVGTTEVRLDLLDAHLEAAQSGEADITKPLVIYDEDRIDEETVSLDGVDVVIAEGVYCSLCEHVDRRVFIARNRLETLEHRMKRAREDFDPFIEQVLTKEHEIISQHRDRADIVITRDYEVEFTTG